MAVISGGQVIAGSWPRHRPFDDSGGAPADGPSGTFAGEVERGQTIGGLVTGNVYVNEGTKASPTWVLVGSQT